VRKGAGLPQTTPLLLENQHLGHDPERFRWNPPHISQVCEMGLHGFHLDVMIGACCIRKVRRNPATRPSQPEKAQISLEGADRRYRNIRIENTLIDEHGDDVRLEKGTHVEVTVTAEPKTVNRDN
jgi:hypothetical protein